MSILSKHLDFWLGDFKWYRDLTESNKYEWMCKHETTFYGQNTSSWERHPKGTFLMINIVKHMVKDNPFILSLSEEEQREIVKRYIDLYYNQN
jgi:hypothetical protein